MPLNERRKLCGYGTGEYEEKRSRFIGEVFIADDEAQARSAIDRVRKTCPDARHHCWAWVLPDGSCRWSDDGEPGGTAGAPMLDILRGAGVFGAVCVVTRYFGGTLLGSGGLVRAYSKAAAAALAAAGTEPDPERKALGLTCRWEDLDRVHRLIREYGGEILEADYDSHPEGPRLRAGLLAESAEGFTRRFTDVTGGRGQILPEP